MKLSKKLVILSILFFSTFYLFADDAVKEILKDYDPETMNEAQAMEISEAFRAAGIHPGPELDELIRAEGFDPEVLRKLAPPPPRSEGEMGPPPGGDHGPMNGNPPMNHTVWKIYESLDTDYGTADFEIHSTAVENGELLEDYKCEEKVNGIEKSIPLSWENVPKGTKSLAILMYHYPNPEDKTGVNSYLLLWGIDPSVKEIEYGEANSGDWYMGQDKDGKAISYTSPCSPSPGVHEYTIALFALASYPVDLPEESSMDVDFGVFMDAVENTEIIGKTELTFKDIYEE